MRPRELVSLPVSLPSRTRGLLTSASAPALEPQTELEMDTETVTVSAIGGGGGDGTSRSPGGRASSKKARLGGFAAGFEVTRLNVQPTPLSASERHHRHGWANAGEAGMGTSASAPLLPPPVRRPGSC